MSSKQGCGPPSNRNATPSTPQCGVTVDGIYSSLFPLSPLLPSPKKKGGANCNNQKKTKKKNTNNSDHTHPLGDDDTGIGVRRDDSTHTPRRDQRNVRHGSTRGETDRPLFGLLKGGHLSR